MQPDLILIPFAENAASGNIDDIPETLSPSDPPQTASWSVGFPPVTMTPLAAGGIPPRGQSFNGVLNAISQHIVYQGGGGQYTWSAEYVAEKGGYPKGAVIQSDEGSSSYVSAVDNNTINFNTTPSSIGVQWMPWAGDSIGLPPDASTTIKGIVELATNAETQSGTDSSRAITPSSLSSRTATDSRTGIVELATQSEVSSLSDNQRAVTPGSLSQLVAQTSPVAGSFSNLKVSSSGSIAGVAVSADVLVVADSSGIPFVLKSLSFSINSATVGAGGLDSGVLSASTWYSVWVIWNGATASGLISLSTTSPTMPSGYTHKARIGWIRTDSTANKYPLSFLQVGRRVQMALTASGNLNTLPVMASGSVGSVVTPTWSAIAVGAFSPPTAVSIKIVATAQTGSTQVIVAPNSSYTGRAGASPAPVLLTFQTGGSQDTVTADLVLESANIYWASSGAANQVQCLGWEDSL